MKVLVTGGAGYIGTHACVELLQAGIDLVVVDNLCNSKAAALDRVRNLSGKDFTFYQADLLDRESVEQIFSENAMDAVMHFAGLKAVGESVAMPLYYYQNNITGTLILCETMMEYGVKNMVFSSSATVYGNPCTLPIHEECPTGPTNPYGQTKRMIEVILADLHRSDPHWNILSLRYFNPVGAHRSGCIGEDPSGIPNNLFPYIAQVASGRHPHVQIFGNDYSTPDGTGVRDYIHITDLVQGHLCALKKLKENPGYDVYNLGTGCGISVLEGIKAFSKASGKEIPFQVVPRRPGDIAACYADPSKANRELGWKAERVIEEMCMDTWRWQQANPNGYEG